jgi:hypothetical protein
MASKTSAADELRSAVGGILERGEEVVGVFLDELLENLHVRDEISKTVRRAAGARKRVEGNIESILTLLSVPTRSDYKHLLRRIDELQGSLVNINVKLDRLLAERAAFPPVPMSHAKPPARRPAARRKSQIPKPKAARR